MTILGIISLLPGGLATFVVVLLMILAVLVYALHCKGDVRAVLSHGRTVLKLEAKERHSTRK